MFDVKLGAIKQSKASDLSLGDFVLYYSDDEENYLEGEVIFIPKREENQVFLIKTIGTNSLMTISKNQDQYYKIPKKSR